MSTKRLHNRLENLFSAIEEETAAFPNLEGSLPVWAWECDAAGCYTSVSDEVVECLGYPANRFIGQPVHLFPVAEAFQPVLQAAIRNPSASETDVYLQAAEGVFLPVRFIIHPLPSKNGRENRRSGRAQVLDFAIPEPVEKKQPATPAKQAEPESPGEKLADDLPGLAALGGEVTPSSQLWTEVARESLDTNQVIAKPSTGEQPAVLAAPIEFRSGETGVLELISSGQVRRWTEDERLLVQEVAHQLALAIENARAYQMAQKAVEEMREVDRLKSQFLANMSHELRTPLNSIIGFSKVILKGIDGPINEVQEQDLTSIYNSGQHLLSLINNILDLSKVEAGKMELQFEEVNLNDIINSVMSTAVGLVKDKPIKLHSIVPPDLPIVIADATRIRQVLLNFLSNAAKFTEEGSITVEAKQIVGPENQPEIQITVTDTGEGIDKADHVKLFLPFSQVDDSPTRKTGGTGLGLSICRSFIELHGGRIGLLHSEVGKGSTFFFTLPLPKEDAADEANEDQNPSGTIVLAIDDDGQVTQLYQRYLEPSGYTVVSLTDPHLAVQQAKELQPAVITLDLAMPGVDGWQVLHDLKHDPATQHIPVIICSLQDDRERGLAQGAADFLVKPFLADELVQAVERLVEKKGVSSVLIVSKSDEDVHLLENWLAENKTLQLATASNSHEARERLNGWTPDVILLDLATQDTDGVSLLNTLQSDPLLCTIPVILLTGGEPPPEQQEQLSALTHPIIDKTTLSKETLLDTLENVLRNSLK